MLDIAIIGGGLSGLSLAQILMTQNRSFAVFESRDRFGGRILSQSATDGDETGFRVDLGPSWIWPDFQPRIADFVQQNDIEVFSQWTEGKALYQTEREAPPQAYVDHETYGPARRVSGGSYRLVETLLQQLPVESLHLSHHLLEVINHDDYVELRFSVDSSNLSILARKVVMTIPPRLLVNSISFTPALDERLVDLMNNTATWMAGHAKAVIRYERAFWREADFSGNALAAYQGAALAEIFDACSADGEQAALSGFFALPVLLREKYRSDLDALILDQLVRLFGKDAAQPDEIIILDWFDERFTATQGDEIPPMGHPQYGHTWLQLDRWNEKLYFSGTETAAQFGGYLEGALESSERVARCLLA
jgi:monoamine oxidase